jgi:hypothetical protein
MYKFFLLYRKSLKSTSVIILWNSSMRYGTNNLKDPQSERNSNKLIAKEQLKN